MSRSSTVHDIRSTGLTGFWRRLTGADRPVTRRLHRSASRAADVHRLEPRTLLSSPEAISLPPSITNFGGPVNFTEDKAAVAIAGNAQISDLDSANFAQGHLTVDLVNGAQSSDRLRIRAGGLLTVDGDKIRYNGELIGTFNGGNGANGLNITLTQNASQARTEVLLHRITFRNVSDDPSTAPRTVEVQLTDGDGGSSLPLSKQITVTAVNDAPRLGGFGPNIVYVEDAGAVRISNTVELADPDSSFDGGELRVRLIDDRGGDRLRIRETSAIDIVGSSVLYQGVIIGSFTGGTDGQMLRVSFNANANRGKVQAIARNVVFDNTRREPSPALRSVAMRVEDGDGGASNIVSKDIGIVLVNDAPRINNFGGDVTYHRSGPSVRISDSAVVNDPDSADFAAGTLRVRLTGGVEASDRVFVRNTAAITVSGNVIFYQGVAIAAFSGGTGETQLLISFNGFASRAKVQAVLRNVAFTNVGSPATANRNVSVQLTDGDGGTSLNYKKQVRIQD